MCYLKFLYIKSDKDITRLKSRYHRVTILPGGSQERSGLLLIWDVGRIQFLPAMD
jgi:hypothetical protein